MSSHGVIRLRLLGTPAIEGAGVDGRAVLNQPKRLALLACLAVRGGFVTRDTLVGLFWPELDEDRARRALSQAIHFLRAELGRRAVNTRGANDVGIGNLIRCDVTDFDNAVGERAWEAALALYGGRFMGGLIAPRSCELNQWMDGERTRLERAAAAAATALSDAAYRREDLPEAIRWQRRALEISPLDEVAHRNHLALLDEAGNTAGALLAHEAFRARLRESLNAEPSPDTSRVVALIRGRRTGAGEPAWTAGSDGTAADPPGTPLGAASLADVRPLGRLDARRVPEVLRQWAAAGRRRLARHARLAIAAAGGIGVTLIGQNAVVGFEPPPVEGRVAVLYFDVLGEDGELRHVADGLTEAVIGYLDRARTLDVVSPNGVLPFRGKQPPFDTIEARLQASTVVRGRLARSAGTTRLLLQVQNAGEPVKGIPALQSSREDLLGILDDLTTQFGEELSPILGDLVAAGRWKAGTESPEAFDHVLRGGEMRKRLDEQIRSGDWAGARLTFSVADSVLEMASRFDADWTEPHILRGDLARGIAFLCMVDASCAGQVPDWLDRAAGHATAALAVNPADAGAFELRGRATYESFVWDAEGGRAALDAADKDLQTALLLDQSRAGALAARSAVLYSKGDFEGAESAAKRALEEDAFLDDRVEIQNRLFLSAFHSEHDREAATWCDAVRAYQGGHWMGAQCLLNLMAWAKDGSPDPDRAWQAITTGLMHESAEIAALYRPRLEFAYAGVLARAGLADSAAAVIARASRAAGDDPEALQLEAAARVALGDMEGARRLLERYLDAAPHRAHVAAFRFFQSPELQPLVAFQAARR